MQAVSTLHRFLEEAATGGLLDRSGRFLQSLVQTAVGLTEVETAAVLFLSARPQVLVSSPGAGTIPPEGLQLILQDVAGNHDIQSLTYPHEPRLGGAPAYALLPFGSLSNYLLLVGLRMPLPLPERDWQDLKTLVQSAATWARCQEVAEERNLFGNSLHAVAGLGRLFKARLNRAEEFDQVCDYVLRLAKGLGCALFVKEPHGLFQVVAARGRLFQGIVDPAVISYEFPFTLGPGVKGVLTVWTDSPVSPVSLQILEGAANIVGLSLEDLRNRDELQTTLHQSIFALSAAIEARDLYTRGHSDRVGNWCAAIGRALGLSGQEAEMLRFAGYLHDVGKIGIPESVLNKLSRYEKQDWIYMKMHPIIGEQIIAGVGALGRLAPGIRAHHENYDGSGYPDGLRGQDIPLFGRIIRVADTFDAITSDRPYKTGKPATLAIEELQAGVETTFDAEVVAAFLQVVRDQSAR